MAVKKTAKPVAKRTYNRKPKESVVYIISARTKLFSWTPIEAYQDYDVAAQRKRVLEAASALGIESHKINKVELVK